jgi:hypothetical protein
MPGTDDPGGATAWCCQAMHLISSKWLLALVVSPNASVSPKGTVSLAAQAEEPEAVAVATGDGLGDGAERFVDLPLVGEAALEHVDLHSLALMLPGEDGPSRRQGLVRSWRFDADGTLFLGRRGGPAWHPPANAPRQERLEEVESGRQDSIRTFSSRNPPLGSRLPKGALRCTEPHKNNRGCRSCFAPFDYRAGHKKSWNRLLFVPPGCSGRAWSCWRPCRNSAGVRPRPATDLLFAAKAAL